MSILVSTEVSAWVTGSTKVARRIGEDQIIIGVGNTNEQTYDEEGARMLALTLLRLLDIKSISL